MGHSTNLHPKTLALVGQTIGKLTVLNVYREVGDKNQTQIAVQCSCGRHKVITMASLLAGTKSCGCTIKHGHSSRKGCSSEYRSWTHMRARCLAPKNDAYKNYGGRGITVDPAWDDFNVFLKDMGLKPHPYSTLERIDTNGNYCKENCQWLRKSDQSKNTRNALYLTYDGQTKHISDWAKEWGIHRSTIVYRVKKGLTKGVLHRGKPEDVIQDEKKLLLAANRLLS